MNILTENFSTKFCSENFHGILDKVLLKPRTLAPVACPCQCWQSAGSSCRCPCPHWHSSGWWRTDTRRPGTLGTSRLRGLQWWVMMTLADIIWDTLTVTLCSVSPVSVSVTMSSVHRGHTRRPLLPPEVRMMTSAVSGGRGPSCH